MKSRAHHRATYNQRLQISDENHLVIKRISPKRTSCPSKRPHVSILRAVLASAITLVKWLMSFSGKMTRRSCPSLRRGLPVSEGGAFSVSFPTIGAALRTGPGTVESVYECFKLSGASGPDLCVAEAAGVSIRSDGGTNETAVSECGLAGVETAATL